LATFSNVRAHGALAQNTQRGGDRQVRSHSYHSDSKRKTV